MQGAQCPSLAFLLVITSCTRLSVTALVPQEDGYDPYRLPYWIRASFIMEERWGELEAEFNAGKEAMRLAEEWGVVSIAPFPLCIPSSQRSMSGPVQACSAACCHAAYPPPRWLERCIFKCRGTHG